MSNGLLGDTRSLEVSRAIAEFQARRPLLLAGDGRLVLGLPVEGLTDARLAEFVALCGSQAPRMVVSARRAEALGLRADGAAVLGLPAAVTAARILEIATEADTRFDGSVEAGDTIADASIALAKMSKVVPAVLIAETPNAEALASVLRIDAASVEGFGETVVNSLWISGRARVPLDFGVQAEFVVFRDILGETAVAIIIGKPDFSQPTQVRLHSACLTGDVFGSRRCDCGDQLSLAIEHLRRKSGGVILYLPQEGRGLGLSNKMRTYRLQDQGLDTVDANTTLGFDDDERDYRIAARMLQKLGCSEVLLLTNNPSKLDGLRMSGIDIAGSLPLEAPVNPENLRYMHAKAARAGHRLRNVFDAMSESASESMSERVSETPVLEPGVTSLTP